MRRSFPDRSAPIHRRPTAAEVVAEDFGEGMLLPGAPRLYVLRGDASAARLSIRRRAFAPLPTIGFIGPTTTVAHLEGGDATVVGIRLRTTTWSLLSTCDLSRWTDKVVPLATLDPRAPLPGGLDDEDAASTFAPWLAARLDRGQVPDAQAARVLALLDAEPRATTADLAAALHLTPQQLIAVCLEKYGLAPRRLMSLRRFRRVLRRLLDDPGHSGVALWEAGYVDRSHFAKDCHKFLGSSFQAFRARSGSRLR